MLLLGSTGRVEAAQRLARESLVAYPDSALLRFAALQPSLGAIARGEVTPEQRASVAALPASAQATVLGSQYLVQGKFSELAQLDAALGEARWTDLWFVEALQLRAEWRSRVSNPGLTRSLGDQAIALIDRVVVVQPSLPAFAIRARAAINADRPDVLVESVANVAQWAVALGANARGESRSRSRATLGELLKLLEGREKDARIDVERLDEVRARINDAIRGLG
jgi:hypothetical protein